MKLSPQLLKEYQENGFLILPELFSAEEIASIRAAMERVFGEEDEANIR